MSHLLNQEHLIIQKSVRDFAEKTLLPGVIQRDIDCQFNLDLFRKAGEQGFAGMMVDTKYQGSGMDALSYALMIEEISKIDASCAVILSVNNSLVNFLVESYGSEFLKEKYLTKMAQGIKLGAFCLSEPEAGSDATSQRTTATKTKDGYSLNGIKNWITSGNTADYYIVFAQTNKNLGHKGVSAFLVEKTWDGITVGPKEDKMGIRASDTHSIIFENVFVPKANLIGEAGKGFAYAMKTLSGGRIGIAAQALGIAQGAYEIALNYAKKRETFGQAIFEHQAVRFKLVDMYTQIKSARYLVYEAALNKDKGLDYNVESSMAKLVASQTAMDVTTEAVQLLGGNGYVREYHVERMMRDAKVTQIYEGTSEIQKIVIGRSLA